MIQHATDTSTPRMFVRRTQFRALTGAAAASAVLSLIWPVSVGAGFFIGSLVSMINFQLMAVDAYDMTGKTPRAARKHTVSRFMLRFAIMLGFLALIVTRTELPIAAAFAGLFFVQAVLVAGEVLRVISLTGKKTKA